MTNAPTGGAGDGAADLRRFFHDLATPLSGASLHLESGRAADEPRRGSHGCSDDRAPRARPGLRSLRARARGAAEAVRVLIVEDDVAIRKGLESAVRDLGGEVRSVGTAGAAARAIEEFDPQVLLVDVHLPDGDGIEVFRAARESDPERDGIVVTGQASARQRGRGPARRSVRLSSQAAAAGAARGRVPAPQGSRATLESEVDTLRGELQETGKLGELIGKSPAMLKMFEAIRRVARSTAPVLITGQSGTGKEVVARTIHRLSRRASAPFVAFNCGAISPTLIESELFGHERGAFTGADKRRIGYFEEANGGTLLLDEITEMGPELQVKLLRVLEAKIVRRVGGTQDLGVDVRLVSATNRDPLEAIEDGKLREDLYYRLNVFPIALPPLAERREDIAAARRALPPAYRRAGKGGRGPVGSDGACGPRGLCLAWQRAGAAQRRASRLRHDRGRHDPARGGRGTPSGPARSGRGLATRSPPANVSAVPAMARVSLSSIPGPRTARKGTTPCSGPSSSSSWSSGCSAWSRVHPVGLHPHPSCDRGRRSHHQPDPGSTGRLTGFGSPAQA